MKSETKVFSYPNGEIQRVQVVRWDDWSKLDFLNLRYEDPALTCFSDIYRLYLVPACPWLFGNMVMFRLPEDMDVPFSFTTGRFGQVGDRLTAAAAALRWGVQFRRGKPVFRDAQVEAFWKELDRQGCIALVRGKLPITTIIPVGNHTGYLTHAEPEAALKVNASFFIMDRFDCATVYDQIGVPLGLCVKDGLVTNPPLYGREALLVRKDGTVSVEAVELRQMELEINGHRFYPGKNTDVFTRPSRARTSSGKEKKIVVIGCRVAAVREGGAVDIPASGFVLCPKEDCQIRPGDWVTYHGLEDVAFGIQVGNSIVRDGEVTTRFRSRFYNIRHLEPVPYPPSLYTMDFSRARAARIALGADRDGRPMLVWAEGAAKLGQVSGQDSRGATLKDMGEICTQLGMVNGVNLDGGGSAQILLKNRRFLRISDRNAGDFSEAERPVPLALIVKE